MAQDVELIWHGEEAIRAVRQAAAEGLTLGAELILGEAVAIVPLDESPLQDSGKVTPATPSDLRAVVSFDTPYAVIQHEDLTLHHPNGRQAKYLERPFRENIDRVMALVAATIARVTK
jgi:hypothetical protein